MRKWCVLLLTGYILTSCRQPSSQVLPTLIPTLGQVEAPTLTALPTEPPTPLPSDRPTLPPTWTLQGQTDSGGTTATALPAPTQEPASQATQVAPPIPEATLVVCGTFIADREHSTSTFKTGQAPQVYWTQVSTATRYRVDIIDQNGTEIFVD